MHLQLILLITTTQHHAQNTTGRLVQRRRTQRITALGLRWWMLIRRCIVCEMIVIASASFAFPLTPARRTSEEPRTYPSFCMRVCLQQHHVAPPRKARSAMHTAPQQEAAVSLLGRGAGLPYSPIREVGLGWIGASPNEPVLGQPFGGGFVCCRLGKEVSATMRRVRGRRDKRR